MVVSPPPRAAVVTFTPLADATTEVRRTTTGQVEITETGAGGTAVTLFLDPHRAMTLGTRLVAVATGRRP